MRAKTIITAIIAMRAIDDIHSRLDSSIEERARAWNNLSAARNALEAELGRISVYVEPPPACFKPDETCAEYYAVDKPDLTVAKP